MPEFEGRQRSGRRKGRHAKTKRKRDNVVMVRIDKGDLGRIDELVESGQFSSRSEATAFLIGEGIKSKQPMFERIAEKVSQIQDLKTELAAMITEDTKVSEEKPDGSSPSPDSGGEN